MLLFAFLLELNHVQLRFHWVESAEKVEQYDFVSDVNSYSFGCSRSIGSQTLTELTVLQVGFFGSLLQHQCFKDKLFA